MKLQDLYLYRAWCSPISRSLNLYHRVSGQHCDKINQFRCDLEGMRKSHVHESCRAVSSNTQRVSTRPPQRRNVIWLNTHHQVEIWSSFANVRCRHDYIFEVDEIRCHHSSADASAVQTGEDGVLSSSGQRIVHSRCLKG